ncbi:MAG TPA: ribose-phosphate pyrophosphokinase [Blastocatellia bacterium]|nr:ribose-phosphate pyrophosphokinase [Blastocatellia bacterium]
MNSLQIFSGNAHHSLAQEICQYLGIELGRANTTRFPDGEFNFQILENVRGGDVFIVQPTSPPVDAHLMELLIMIDAFRRSSADRITAVIPYYGYGRSDKKDKPRIPISARLVANLITTAGANRVLTVDLHTQQIQGFFDIPVDHLFAAPLMVDYFMRNPIDDLVVVAPDPGGAERARAYAKEKRLDADFAIIDKRREKSQPGHADAEVMNVVGNVEGRNALIVDDMVDTGGTLTKVAEALAKKGAVRILTSCVHAVLSGNAIERIKNSPLEKVVMTNTLPVKDVCQKPLFEYLSIAPLLAEAIKSIHEESSVSRLFI